MFRLKTWMAGAAMVALAGTAQATLINLGDGTVKDDVTNLIWLQDWGGNVQQTSWATKTAWAETGLDGFAGSNNWHLPSIQQFIDLFAAYGDLSSNTLPFTNVSSYYWSSTEYVPDLSMAYFFDVQGGNQFLFGKHGAFFAVAVQEDDVAAAVPEPQAFALVLLGLGAAAVARRRRASQDPIYR